LGVLHNTVIRGGVGFFYDPVPGNLAQTLSSNPPLLNSYSIFGDNLSPDEKTSLSKDAVASNSAFVRGFAAGQTLAQIQDQIPDGGLRLTAFWEVRSEPFGSRLS
jgi:hypothetical protein